jgi:hypothetical protein
MSPLFCTHDEFKCEKYQTSKGILKTKPPKFNSKSDRTRGWSVAAPTMRVHSFPAAKGHIPAAGYQNNSNENADDKCSVGSAASCVHGEFFRMGDQALGSTRHDVPLSMIALAYGARVRLWASAGGAQKCNSSFPAYLKENCHARQPGRSRSSWASLDAEHLDSKVALTRDVGGEVHAAVHACGVVASQLQLGGSVIAHMRKALQQGVM